MYRELTIACLAATLLACAVSARADDLDLDAEPALDAVAWSGDLLVRQDWLDNGNGSAGDLARLITRLRYGPTWQIDDAWSLAGALRVDAAGVGNANVVRDHDNQRPRDLALDALHLDYVSPGGHRFEAGKDALPLNLSRMVWDSDLRPAGLSYGYRGKLGEDTALNLAAGAFLGQHLSGDQSRLSAFQAGVRFDEHGSLQPELILSYLHFTDLDPLARAGLGRGNPLNLKLLPCSTPPCTATQPLSYQDRYELADLQFALHVAGETPFRLLLDAEKNLGAVAGADHAGRMELALGDSTAAGGSEFGIALERMQRSAVLAAFNEDDWWFHAGSHGTMLWYGYGWSERLRLRAGLFREQPDASPNHWNRLLLDLQWRL